MSQYRNSKPKFYHKPSEIFATLSISLIFYLLFTYVSLYCHEHFLFIYFYCCCSGSYSNQFHFQVSKEMTQLVGRVLQPPKLQFGDTGHVRDITPNRQDWQWNFLNSHVTEGSTVRRCGGLLLALVVQVSNMLAYQHSYVNYRTGANISVFY
jgi:hypothetical protein